MRIGCVALFITVSAATTFRRPPEYARLQHPAATPDRRATRRSSVWPGKESRTRPGTSRTKNRSTPLGLAARFGRREMVEFLLERGANPSKAGAPWAKPVEWARQKGHGDIAARLATA